MTALVPPRYELPIDMAGNRITREWYKYLVILGNSIGGSTTSTDDQQLSQVTDDAAVESIALRASRDAKDALSMFLLNGDDKPQTPDASLLAWWPGNTI
jgi:hypothetical protein